MPRGVNSDYKKRRQDTKRCREFTPNRFVRGGRRGGDGHLEGEEEGKAKRKRKTENFGRTKSKE